MTVPEARARCAAIHALPWSDTALDVAILQATAQLIAASPQVTPVRGAPGLWWVGASGFDGLGGEQALAHALLRIAKQWHPRPRVAIADTCVTARAATWAGASFASGGDERSLIHVVHPGGDANYLATAPLALLPIEEELRETLRALGLRDCGGLAQLDAGDVERRWGSEGLGAWRLSRGEDARRPVLARQDACPSVETELATPAPTMEPILFLAKASLQRLATLLASQGRAIAVLAVTLTLDDARGALPNAPAHTVTRELRLPRPSARWEVLFERCRGLLAGWALTAPVSAVSIAVIAAAPLSGDQGDLLAPTWRDPATVEAALARLRAELGPNVVVKPVVRDSYVPERAGAWIDGVDGDASASTYAAHEAATVKAKRDRAPLEPRDTPIANGDDVAPALRLLERAELVDMECDADVPRRFTWRARPLAVQRASGPERLSGDWWDQGYRRDYWRCATEQGEFMVYLDRADDGWRVQGWYD